MSFIIAVHVNEGIVLASDRRITYTNNTRREDGTIIRSIGIHTNNSTDKTFLCPNGCGISTCGEASLEGKPITGFIQDFIRTCIQKDTNTSDIPNLLLDYFSHFSEVPDSTFIIAGYATINGSIKQVIFRVFSKSHKIETINTDSQGAIWDGETYTLTRLLQPVAIKRSNSSYSDLPYEEILWNYFTLQDAVDFARYAVETTINTMHFKNVIETVGGKIDILVITPEKTEWLQREELK